MQLKELPKRFSPLWHALTPRRRKQMLGLQLLGLLVAVGEVANLGALLPFLRLLASPAEGLKALGPLAEPLRNLPQQHLLLSLGLGFMAVVVDRLRFWMNTVTAAVTMTHCQPHLPLGLLPSVPPTLHSGAAGAGPGSY